MSNQQPEYGRGRSNKVMFFTCALIMVAAVVIGVIINNATAETRFKNEIAAVNSAFSKSDEKKIDEMLGRTVSAGNYAKVEKCLKNYVGDLMKNVRDVEEATHNEVVYKALEGEYLAANRDKLSDVAKELKQIGETVKIIADNNKRLYDEAGAKSYIESENLDQNFSDLFVENAKLFYGDKDLKDNSDSTLNVLIRSINTEIKAVEYLAEHKSGWKVDGKKLTFTDGTTNNEFQKILQNVANN